MDGTPFGRYRLMELLGRGDISDVWRAFDTSTGRVVALKVWLGPLTQDRIFRQRFHRETRVVARLLANLNNPHIAAVYDVDEIDDRLCVSTLLVDGADLESTLRDGARSIRHGRWQSSSRWRRR